MGKMMFLNLCRNVMKECIGKTTSSVLLNGSLIDGFTLDRGLRQGNPFLLLFFFLLLLAS